MKTLNKLVVLLIFVVLAVSCSKVDASISDVVATVGTIEDVPVLSVWVKAEIPSDEDLEMTVTNPQGNLTWTVFADSDEYLNDIYYGYTGFILPRGNTFETGTWTVELKCRDGQVATESFRLQ